MDRVHGLWLMGSQLFKRARSSWAMQIRIYDHDYEIKRVSLGFIWTID
jgi:hypothetical protein